MFIQPETPYEDMKGKSHRHTSTELTAESADTRSLPLQCLNNLRSRKRMRVHSRTSAITDSFNRINMGRGKEPMRPPPSGPGQSSRTKEGDIKAQRLAHMEDLELQAALDASAVQFVPNPCRSNRLHINEPAASMPTPSQQNEDNLYGVEDDSDGKKARRRGPSQAQTTSKRQAVDFNERGQPVGPGSDRYVTNLGVWAREYVSPNYNDWRRVPQHLKDRLWSHVTQGFEVDEEEKKHAFSKMGKILRDHRYLLGKGVVDFFEREKNGLLEEGENVNKWKPSQISDREWLQFIDSRISEDFKAKSAKYREIRSHQEYVHRTSRRGFARLEHEMRQAADDSSLVHRVDVWREGHTPQDSKHKKKDKKSTDPKIVEIMQSPVGQSQTSLDDDPLTHVLGRELAGRVRGMGFGVTPSQVRVTVRASKGQTEMQKDMSDIKEKLEKISAAMEAAGLYHASSMTTTSTTASPSIASTSMRTNQDVLQPSSNRVPETQSSINRVLDPPQGIENARCELLSFGRNPYVVAHGQIASTDPAAFVHNIPLGRGYYKVWIHHAVMREYPLCRQTVEHQTIGDAEHSTTVWPIDCIQFN